jgi:serine/threonine protein kinase/tetratricopeptide (TPR) repeat protein
VSINTPSVETILSESVAIPTAADRAAYLDRACGDDQNLRAQLEKLVADHFRAGSFLERPPVSPLAPDETAGYEPAGTGPAVGTRVGPYVLREQIGEGGMGLVFVADQTEPVKRRVALKVIKPGMDTREVVARFEAERQALALMEHPNIATVLDAGATPEGRPFFVMELVRGTPIAEYCDEHRLTVRQRLELFLQVCAAVQHAHQKGVIHRDLKPTNVLVAVHDVAAVAKVIDFGIAKAVGPSLTDRTVYTAFAQVVGTPLYMSPEQAGQSALDIDTRTDIYSLGVLLYELLAGATPFDGDRLRSVGLDEFRRIVREEEPARPSHRLSTLAAAAQSTVATRRQADPRRLAGDLRGDLDWVVMKCLEKDRERRYESAGALAADVRAYLADEPVAARPPSAAYRLKKFVKRRKGPMAAAGLVALALLAGFVGTTWGMVRALDEAGERKQAEEQAKFDRNAAVAAAEERAKAEQRATADRDAARGAEADTRAFSEFLVNHVLAAARPRGLQGGLGIRTTVVEALEAAEGSLDEVFKGRPLAEAEARHAIGVTWRNLARYKKAIEHLRRAAELRERELGPDAELTLDSYNSLGVALGLAGRYREAVTVIQQAHARAMSKHGADQRLTLILANQLATGYLHTGQLEESAVLSEQILERRRSIFGPDHPDTLHTMCILAYVYARQGLHNDAITMAEAALNMSKKSLGPYHLQTLDTDNTLALIYGLTGRHLDALALHERTLEQVKKEFGEDHPTVLAKMHNIALAYQKLGRTEESIVLHEQVLSRFKTVLGADHPQTLQNMSSLATAYARGGRLRESLSLYEQVVELRRSVLGPDHPDSLFAQYHLGSAYRLTGRLQDAVELLEGTLEKQTAILGTDHPQTVDSMGELGKAYQDVDRPKEAVTLCERAHEGRLVLFGPDHPDTLASMNNLANVYLEMGRAKEALALQEQAVEKLKTVLGLDHPGTLKSLITLAAIYVEVGRRQDGLKLYEQVMERRRVVLGPDHHETLQSILQLGAMLRDEGELDQAERVFRQLLERHRKRGPRSVETAKVMVWLGVTLGKQKQYDESVQLLREAIAIRDEKEPDDWIRFLNMSHLGSVLLRQQRYAEAEELLLKGYEGMKKRWAKAPVEYRNVTDGWPVERLAHLYEETGQLDKAREWRLKVQAEAAPPARLKPSR